MQTQVKVSIIIVNYNTFKLTENCIRSIITWTKIPYEIIIVDNASKDQDPNKFTEIDSSIKIIVNESNLGFAVANNIGINYSCGEFILLLNSDTELANNAIDIAIEQMEQNVQIGVLSGKLIFPNGKAQSVANKFPSIKKEIFELLRLKYLVSGRFYKKFSMGDIWDYSKKVKPDWVWGTFFLIRRCVINNFPNKRLHENYFMYFEDVLWCYYIRKYLKLHVQYSPEPIIIHHLSASSKDKNYVLNKTIKNEAEFLKEYKGVMYSIIYYLIKGIHQLSLRKRKNLQVACTYFNQSFRTLL